MSDEESAPQKYRFGDYRLDVRRAELSGPAGRISLRPQSFDVLRLLVSRHGRLVSKDELYEQIWGNRAVTDDSLTQCLIDIRKALGDSRRRIVRTVPRRGYIFTPDVSTGAGDSEADRQPGKAIAPRTRIVALTAVVLVLAAGWLADLDERLFGPRLLENSVAVLPFVDLSARQNQQYLGDSLSEDIISALTPYRELNVIARTSSFAMAERSKDIAEIRDNLRVAFVLEGSVRRSGDQVTIIAQLIETDGSTHVWSNEYPVSLQEMLTIHNRIAAEAVQSIVPNHVPVNAALPQLTVAADDYMRLARQLERELQQHSELDRPKLSRVIELYQAAVDAAPDSALAHGRLAGALLYGGDVAAAGESVMRASELNPELSEVQEVLGRYYWATNKVEQAGAAWNRARELNPANVDAIGAYATWHWVQKDSDLPVELFRQALELDPLNLNRYSDLGFIVASKADTEETAAIVDRVLELFDGPDAWRLVARLLDYSGKIDESIAWTIRALEAEPDNPLHRAALAEFYIDIGDYDTADALQPKAGFGLLMKMRRYQEAIDEGELLMIDEPDDVHLRYLLAFAYNATGQPADAIRIFKHLGIEDSGLPLPRQIIDIEARFMFADALSAAGETESARDLAQWAIDFVHIDTANWWPHLYSACSHAIIGRDDEALNELEQVARSPRLPWRFLVRDSHCFQRFSGNERYRQVIERIERRLAETREKLPGTLQRFGVDLQGAAFQ
jgi:TolB-like protein/DNA-binding winged helix-turn-helix (wHTH) protein/tetratricopeptide (TPR) repeat protein